MALPDFSEHIESQSQETPSQAPSQAPSPGTESGNAVASPTDAQAAAVAELSLPEKFLYGGKEWTKQEWLDGHLRQKDYSQKTEAIAQERKFYANLEADLNKVRGNPRLASAFREIYPKSLHWALGTIQGQEQPRGPEGALRTGQPGQENRSQLPPEIQEKLEQYDKRLSDLDGLYREDKVLAASAKIEVQERSMLAKYPLFNGLNPKLKEGVIKGIYDDLMQKLDEKRQEAELQGLTAPVELEDGDWDKVWKEHHSLLETSLKGYQKQQFDSQKKANAQGKETGAGGGTPSAAPKRMKLKDVADHILSSGQV